MKELLKDKWIAPVVNGLAKLPGNIVNEFVSKLEALAKKYETTFFEVEEEIRSVESSLTGKTISATPKVAICYISSSSKPCILFG